MYTAGIFINKTEITKMGWEIESIYTNFILNITPSESKMWLSVNTEKHKGVIDFNSDEYTFDWSSILEDLKTIGKLFSPFCDCSAVLVDDYEEKRSYIVSISDIGDVLDMPQSDLACYRSIEDINSDLYGLHLKNTEENAKFSFF